MSAHVEIKNVLLSPFAALAKMQRRKLAGFKRDENGSIIIFSLFLLILMLMISGMAVDLMRSETLRSRLQSTTDRAVLAAASLDQALDSEDVVRDYFKKAGLDQYLVGVSVTDADNKKTVSASALIELDTMFMRLMNIRTLNTPAIGSAEESLSNIEISLIVDVSGSMGRTSSSGNSKLYDLKEAANEFAYMMQCNPDDPTGSAACTVEADSVSISLIPYAEQVLVGETLLTQFKVTSEHSASSCVDFETSDFASTSLPLATDVAATPLNRSTQMDRWTNYYSSSYSRRYARDYRRNCRVNTWREIVPFENSYTDLQAKINSMSAGGNTSIDTGMKWGVALLDPAFRPVAVNLSGTMIPSAFSDRPYDFDARSMQKVVVLMTDGQNTSQYYSDSTHRTGPSPFWRDPDNGDISVYRASTNKYRHIDDDNNWHDDPDDTVSPNDNVEQLTYEQFWAEYNADFFEEAGGSGFLFEFNRNQYTAKNSRLDAICTSAKAQDIEVFTIGFETTDSSNLILQSCASSDSHHFDVDGLDLSAAFAAIAREIHELRLVN